MKTTTESKLPGFWVILTEWILEAGKLPGKSLQVAVRLLVLRTQAPSNRVTWRPLDTKHVGVSRTTLYRALQCLEGAGLVQVTRQKGEPPLVTVLDGYKQMYAQCAPLTEDAQ